MKVGYSELGRTGRLGNALFEFAATYGIARANGGEPRFNADWIHRWCYNVPDEFFTYDFSDCRSPMEWAQHIDERARMYLQDVNLFVDHLSDIRKYLTISIKGATAEYRDSKFWDLPKPILSVHVRRGDNIVDPGVPDKYNYHRTPPLAWYQQNIKEMESRFASVAVFSDDPQWCRDNLEADYYHEGLPRPKEHERNYLTAPVKDYIDLDLQSWAHGHIISGSTFGIWGAILANSQNVRYARPVYGKKLSFIDESLLFLPHWKEVRY